MSDLTCGFLFAFKTYVPQREPNAPLDCIENLVHHLTHSDLIHVEIIPAWKKKDEDLLLASHTAHTAYVGYGYNAHPSHTCIEDPSYMQVFVPVAEPRLHEEGVRFLHSMHGRRYNYLALPLTILPEFCKFRAIKNTGALHTFDTSKVFCSQMGLVLCYLCHILRPEYHYHGQSIIFDPLCCTPADLYRLLLASNSSSTAAEAAVRVYQPHQIRILMPTHHDEGHPQPSNMSDIYDTEGEPDVYYEPSYQGSAPWQLCVA